MEELESQIAKIQLGNPKTSNSYVYTLVEKAPSGDAELYVVAELPLLNPAALEACERICLAIGSGLKRAYKRTGSPNNFENAISQINDELGKLASMGQTQWIDKLSCILGVKEGHDFYIATTGKVSAYLLRSGEYTDISCSGSASHPLKTFENYAVGKVRLGDVLLLSTTQLFNHLSMDRLMDIVSAGSFLTATRTIIELLKQNSDPQVSFGVVLNLQVPEGENDEQEADLENYAVEPDGSGETIYAKALAYLKTAFALDRSVRAPQVALPKISMADRLKNISGSAKNLAAKSKSFWQATKTSAQGVKENVNVASIKNLSPQKRFLLISAIILLLAVVGNVLIAAHIKKVEKARAQVQTQLKAALTLLTSSQGSLLYQDDSGAAGYLAQAKAKIPAAAGVDSANKNLYNQVLAQLAQTETQMEKIVEPTVTNLGSLGPANNLIKLPGYLATQANGAVLSYNKQNGKVEDSALNLGGAKAVSAADINATLAAIYDGSNLFVWDFTTGKVSPGFSQSLPALADFAGMASYPTNNRVYVVNKKTADVVSFLASKSGFSRPMVAAQDESLSQAFDITIDGNIYVLGSGGVSKFSSGRLASFGLAQLPTPLSGSGKIYTEKGFLYLYILDSGNNRILIFTKTGALVHTLQSSQFTKLKDFQVDEKNKLMFVLNDSSLLKVVLP